MKLIAAAAFAVFVSVPLGLHAQESLVGKYNTQWQTQGQRQTIAQSISLNIDSVEDGAVKGSATRTTTAVVDTACAGDYPMAGTLKDKTLHLTGKGGRAGNCPMTLRLTADGDKLVGKFGNNDLVFSKQ